MIEYNFFYIIPNGTGHSKYSDFSWYFRISISEYGSFLNLICLCIRDQIFYFYTDKTLI